MVIRRELAFGLLAIVGVTGYLALHSRGTSQSAPPVPSEPSPDVIQADVEKRARPALPVRDPAPPPAPKSRLARLFANEASPNLRPDELDSYLQANHRSRDSLLGAYRTTRDPAFLREALENYPNDPRVHFDAVFFGPAEERRKWLEAFKESASANALPYYLSARDYFKAGQPDLAVEEVVRASTKTGYQDYSLDYMQNAEEAYRAAGYSDLEAKATASTQLLLPQLAELKQTAVGLVDLAKSYRQAGNEDQAQNMLQMAIYMGQRLDSADSLTLIQPLVGIAVQRMALAEMDPNTSYGDSGQTVQNRLDALAQERSAMREPAQNLAQLLPTLQESELSVYFDRQRLFGERATMNWLQEKYGRN